MIIFGTDSKVHDAKELNGVACPSCGKEELHQLSIYKYFHLFWIPTFPYRKKKELECTHCRAVFEEKEIPESVKPALVPFASGMPASLFSGIAVILALIVFLEYNVAESRMNDVAYLSAPKANDMYVVEYPKDSASYKQGLRYGVLKVVGVGDGSGKDIQLVQSNYGYEYWSDAAKQLRKGAIILKDFFDNDVIDSSVTRLKEMHSEGSIKRVVRDARVRRVS